VRAILDTIGAFGTNPRRRLGHVDVSPVSLLWTLRHVDVSQFHSVDVSRVDVRQVTRWVQVLARWVSYPFGSGTH
jgi:hypothetical protein